jgi:hypothetical protein
MNSTFRLDFDAKNIHRNKQSYSHKLSIPLFLRCQIPVDSYLLPFISPPYLPTQVPTHTSLHFLIFLFPQIEQDLTLAHIFKLPSPLAFPP